MITDVALKEVGYTEGQGNANKYSKALGRPPEAWCADFVSWCAKEAGDPVFNSAGVIQWFQWAQKNGLLISPSLAQRNDLLIFSWDYKTLEHIGICIQWNLKTHLFDTVEGNTASSNTGNQSNGDQVALKHRPPSCVKYAIRPKWKKT
jgi:CHAP domain